MSSYEALRLLQEIAAAYETMNDLWGEAVKEIKPDGSLANENDL